MRGLIRATLNWTVVVALLLAATQVKAAEAPKTESTKRRIADGTSDRSFAIPKEITLTTEQQAALEAIKKEHAAKVLELSKKLANVLTEQQKSARRDATAKAKADGKMGKDRTILIDDAVKLTDEQKQLLAEIKPELAKLRRSIREQIHALMTDDQKSYHKMRSVKKTT